MIKNMVAVGITAAFILAGCGGQPVTVPPAVPYSPGTPSAPPKPAAASPTDAPKPAAPAAASTAAGAAAPAAAPASPAGDRAFSKLSPADRGKISSAPPPMAIDKTKKYIATIKTSKGEIKIELDPSAAPQTVNNFVYLSTNGFYDGLTFHRVEPDFVIQGGDPAGNGSGGPGYNIPPEIKLPHVAGAIAMARRGGPPESTPSSGSQFYITLAATPNLDGNYTAFGKTIAGMDVVKKIVIGDKIERVDIVEASGSAVAPIPTAIAVAAAPADCKAVEDKVFKDVPELVIDKDDLVIGNPNAISTLVEYADLQCPSCAALHPILKSVMPQISDTVKLVFRHFPLVNSHDKAMIAARGGVAAQEQGKFNEYQDLLYTKQADWDKTPVAEFTKTLSGFAADLKLDVAKFEATLAKPETQARVDRDRKTGEALKVPGTPTLFLDGQPFQPAVLGNPATIEQIKTYTQRRQAYKEYLGKKPVTFAKPDQVIAKGDVYEVTIKTSKGDVVLELDGKLAPGNVNSTIFLMQKGFYGNMPVLVNEPQFNAVLFGDPSGTGFASPGYDCAPETDGKFDKPGVVGLFRSVSNPDNSGAQLVIAYDASPQLDGDLTVIGQVTKGLEIVKSLVGEEGKDKQDKLISTTVKKK